MLYLILQMALLLAIASLLSAAIGWLARRFFHEKHLLERRSDEKRRAVSYTHLTLPTKA